MENQINHVVVKGTNDGLMLILPEGEWEEVRSDIIEKINSQSAFFKGADAYIDVGSRDMRVTEVADLRDCLSSYEIRMIGLLSFSEITRKNAKSLGLDISMPQKRTRKVKKLDALNPNESSAFLVQKNIRSGIRIEKEEDIVIVGDVNPGAEIISGGSVFVWGKIKGKITAGANGNEQAVVGALFVEDSQVSIAGIMRIFSKRLPKSNLSAPLILKIQNGDIVADNIKS